MLPQICGGLKGGRIKDTACCKMGDKYAIISLSRRATNWNLKRCNKMKKATLIIITLIMTLIFIGCDRKDSGGNIDDVHVPDWKPSEIYSDDDIEAAYQTVTYYFSDKFDGCTLTKIYYPGDTYADEFSEWAEQYDADEAIVLLSSFDVDASGGDGSLNANSTYDDWNWILIRNDGGDWELVDYGY